VTIKPLAPDAWKRIKDDCAGQVGSLLDLLAGRLGDGVLRAISDPERGLFPKPSEIKLICSCPDSANMCKHVAAVLYGVGVMLDGAPDLFFVLRSVDPSELLSGVAGETLAGAHGADSALSGEDLSALFGIALDTPASSEITAEKPRTAKPEKIRTSRKKPGAKKAETKKAVPKKIPKKKAAPKKASAKKSSAPKKR
jgi:uncharacterized Zn finger protein